MRAPSGISAVLLLPAFLVAFAAAAQNGLTLPSVQPQTRITERVDSSRLVRLKGATHPAIAHAADLGQVDPSLPMDRMQLVLRRSPEQEAALTQFLADQLDPKSPLFHHWISATEFGQRFGVSDVDLATITNWLTGEGFQVNSVSKGRLSIEFSGTANQVAHAFHTEIHRYNVKGEEHIANQEDPSIPEALTPVVVGVASLNNFHAKGQSFIGGPVKQDPATGKYQRQAKPLTPFSGSSSILPLYTGSVDNDSGYFLAPYDFATVYNETPLWTAGTIGSGVHVAISGRSDVYPSDVALFRSSFGLPLNPLTTIHNGADPGIVSGDQGENTLDVEWAGATAPGAKVDLVVSASTNVADGFVLSAQYIIDNQVASIMSSSYGNCELALGTAGNTFFNSLWQQASAEGISAFVSAGDGSSAGCDNFDQNPPYEAVDGLAVSGIASSPYVTAVGGTDFGLSEASSPGTYFNSTNASNGSSAKGYIPEVPWNDSCASTVVIGLVYPGHTPEQTCNVLHNQNVDTFLLNIVGGSGGVSACTTPSGTTPSTCSGGYAKPSWQTGTGVPADGKRDVPDISFLGARGEVSSAYLFYENGTLSYAGGTSISSPSAAGVMALVLQTQGAPQGLANPVFYSLAAKQTTSACSSDTVAAGNSCYFYDTTTGNNSVPCTAGTPNCIVTTSGDTIGILGGYTTTAGYDLATGLGSANVTNMVRGWSSVVGTQTVTLTVSPSTLPNGNVSAPYYQQITASGGTAPYIYAVTSGALPTGLSLSGSGYLTGIPTAPGVYSFTISATDRSVSGPYTGSTAYVVTILPALTQGTLSWLPARDNTYTGLPIGADVLDATDSTAGTIAYTALLANSSPAVSVTPTTVLSAGMYTLTATFTPSAGGTASTATIPFNVLPEYIWVANSAGNVFRVDAGGNSSTSFTAGGVGLAFDQSGAAWSGNTAGTSLSTYVNAGSTGNAFGTASGGGLTGATAVALDSAGAIWVANNNGSVSQLSNLGVAISPASGYTGGGLSTSTGIALDISGNVWVSNAGNNSVTQILGAAAPTQPLTNSVVLGTPAAKP